MPRWIYLDVVDCVQRNQRGQIIKDADGKPITKPLDYRDEYISYAYNREQSEAPEARNNKKAMRLADKLLDALEAAEPRTWLKLQEEYWEVLRRRVDAVDYAFVSKEVIAMLDAVEEATTSEPKDLTKPPSEQPQEQAAAPTPATPNDTFIQDLDQEIRTELLDLVTELQTELGEINALAADAPTKDINAELRRLRAIKAERRVPKETAPSTEISI